MPASRVSRATLYQVLCAGLLAIYVLLCTRELLFFHYLEQATNSSLMRAARLEPRSAEAWSRIGRHELFASADPAKAERGFRRALELDRYDANTWLDLAAAKQMSGDLPAAQQAVLRALEVDRSTPSIHWRAATYFLSKGDDIAALREIKVAAEHSRAVIPDAIHVVWNVTHQPQAVIDALPSTDFAYQETLAYFIRAQNVAAADVAWQHLKRTDAVGDMDAVAPYTELLLVKGETDKAVDVWSAYCASHSRMSYCDDSNSLRNGSFEETLLRQGFDWHIYQTTGMQVGVDFSTAYDGARSLRLDYSDTALAEAGVYQLVPLHPNSSYRLTGVYKPDALLALNAPQIVVDDPKTQRVLVRTPALEGLEGWRHFSVTFDSGDVDLARLRVLHLPVEGPIHGTLWIDALRLEKQ